jgi:hypothetical protein
MQGISFIIFLAQNLQTNTTLLQTSKVIRFYFLLYIALKVNKGKKELKLS